MAAITSIALGAAVAGTVAKGAQAISANQKAQSAKGDAHRAKNNLAELEASRQEIINPYEGMESVAGMATDASGMLKNRMANIGVATQAAEIEIEQADIALANTLDTLAATGASAGGATALAQAALQSKKGVAANIEQQEASNEKMRAQGEQYLQQAEIGEQRRLQQIQISEGQRTQQADAAGRSFKFNAQERRKDAQINFTRGQINQQTQRAQQAYDQGTQAITGAITGGFGALGDIASAGGFFKGGAEGAKAAGYNLAGSNK